MGENLYVGSHKSSNKAYRDHWDETFKKKDKNESKEQPKQKKNDT